MKRVTLYTINAEERHVYDLDEKINLYILDEPPIFLPIVDSDPKELMVTTVSADIRRVIKRGEEIYVAIDPELEQILMAPKTGMYNEKIYRLSAKLSASEARIDGYNNLPWWKKILIWRI